MSKHGNGTFTVGDWYVEPARDRMSRKDESAYLRPQIMELLTYLAHRKGQVVSADELLASLWQGKVVTPSNVYNCVAELRQALANGDDRQPYIETIPKKGYRLLAPVAGGEPESGTNGFRTGRRAWQVTTSIVVAAVSITVLLVYRNSWTDRPEPPVETTGVRQYTITLPSNMQFYRNRYGRPTISADGRRVTFGAIVDGTRQLVSRSFDQLDVLPIKATEYARRVHALSPDGNWIVYIDSRDSLLKKVPIDGGIPTIVCDPGGNVWDIDWGPNGRIAFASDAYEGILQVAAVGGTPQPLTTPPTATAHKHPYYLADGSAILYTVGERGQTIRDSDRIEALSLESGQRVPLMPGASPSVALSGHLVYYRGHALWAAEFDTDNLEIIGGSVPISENVYYSDHAHFSLSDNGTLVYVVGTDLLPRSLVWVDRAGNEEALPIDPRPFNQPRVSPDGKRIAAVVKSGTGADLWVFEPDRGFSTRLTFDEPIEALPLWSRDGRYLYYSSDREDNLYRVAMDGVYAAEKLTDTPHRQLAHAITPDDGTLLIVEAVEGTRVDVSTLTVNGDRKIAPLVHTEWLDIEPTLSPDGRWFAYTSNQTGHLVIYARQYVSGSDVINAGLAIGRGIQPLWSPSGREIIYWSEHDLMTIDVEADQQLNAGSPQAIFPHDNYVFHGFRNFDFDPAGERILMVKGLSDYERPENRIVVIDNWVNKLTRKLASR